MPIQQAPEIDRYGHLRDPVTGLYVPSTYARSPSSAIITYVDRTVSRRGFSQGLELDRDENTLAVKFPRKGSGWDDLISSAIVDGRVANAGMAPVIAPQISAMVRRQQNQALSATIDVTGRPTPTAKARDAIAMFNDSPLGINAALETIVYRLCTYNRGAPIATVPITFEFETWEEYGMTAHPILSARQKEENATRFWLEVDWQKFGTPVPFLPHPFDLEPTGNEQYPYWYRATRKDGKKVWVLLHNTQIVPMLPGTTSQHGIGNSPTWMSLGWLAENILFTDERNEKMLYSMTDGVTIIGGVPDADPKAIKKEIEDGRIERIERGFRVHKGQTLIVSPTSQVSVAEISLRKPSGIEFKDWHQYGEDVIVFCFGETLSAIATRGGVGYGAQAEAAADNTTEVGVGAHLARLGGTLGAIYPRVMVTVTRSNDRAARANVKTFAQFAGGAATMIDKGVWTATQVNRIIDRDIMTVPEDDEVTTSTNANDRDDDLEEDLDERDEQPAQPVPDEGTQRKEASVQILYRLAHVLENPYLPEGYSRRLQAMTSTHAYEQIYFRDDSVTITDLDENRAYEAAKRRVGDDVYQLLIAKPVEDAE